MMETCGAGDRESPTSFKRRQARLVDEVFFRDLHQGQGDGIVRNNSPYNERTRGAVYT